MLWPSSSSEPDWRRRTAARLATAKQVAFVWALSSWAVTAATGPRWFDVLPGVVLPSIVLPLVTNGLLVVCIVGERLVARGDIAAPTDGRWRGGLAVGGLLLVASVGLTIAGAVVLAGQG